MRAAETVRSPGMWERLVGQETAVRALKSSIDADRVGHAYLFAGPQGVGRALAALALAASVNCADNGCGSCDVCSRILRGAHPDVHPVAAEGGQIVVDQVRAIREEAARAPFEGRRKVFIMDEAERLNPAAANALLKVLEEPAGGSLFVLMTEAPDDVLPTVVSRCRRVEFAPLGLPDIVRVLIDHHGVTEDRARWSATAGGDLATALRLAKDEEAEERRARHLGYPERLAASDPAEAIRLADAVRAEADAAVAALAQRQREEIKEHADAFGEGRGTGAARRRLEVRHKREAKRAELKTYEIVLADLSAWFRAVLHARTGAVEDAVDDQVVRALGPLARRAGPTQIAAALDRIEGTRRAITRNAHLGLAMEALFMDLGRVT